VPDRHRHRRRDGARALALVAVLFVAIGGCGGDDGDDDGDGEAATVASETAAQTQPAPTATAAGAQSDEQLIRAAIEGALASGDPAKACDRFVTEAYVVTAYGDRAGCDAAVTSGGSATSVKVSAIAVSGETGTAVAVPTGGPSNGERLDVSLIREGDVWQVDSLRSNVPVGP
jgi:hypothetical protein